VELLGVTKGTNKSLPRGPNPATFIKYTHNKQTDQVCHDWGC